MKEQVMKQTWKDDTGVNIILDYLLTFIITMILFTMMIMIINDVMNISDRIVLKEEFDIISNDIANRVYAFASDVNMSKNMGLNSSVAVLYHTAYFDLPELIQSKQYRVDITYDESTYIGTVVVTYVSNSNVFSTSTFYSLIPVEEAHFYSQQGRYGIFYNSTLAKIQVRNGV